MSDSEYNAVTIAKCAVAVFGVAAVIYGLLSCSSSTKGKTMKAPARNQRMFRADFERDTAGYFRNLRKK